MNRVTTGLYRPVWTIWKQRRGIGRKYPVIAGPERFVAEKKVELGKMRGLG